MGRLTPIVSLLPLDPAIHAGALHAVYQATPGYWALYNLPGCPPDQAQQDLDAVAATPGRYMLGIVKRLDPDDAAAGAELIGLLDFRLHWPDGEVAYIGMLMVAEPYQRQGIGTQAWSLLRPWLASSAGVRRVRLGVEQFNSAALQFWQRMGLTLTGESNRIRVGDQFVRLLYMEEDLAGVIGTNV